MICWKFIDTVDLTQVWNFFTRPNASKCLTDKLLCWIFTKKVDPTRITTINAWGCEAFNNRVLEMIASNGNFQRNLKNLNIRMTSVNSDGVKHLPMLMSLQQLTLMGGLIDRDIAIISTSLPQLQRLLLVSSNITDNGLVQITRLQQLRELQLTG
jgi:hypothetical protein